MWSGIGKCLVSAALLCFGLTEARAECITSTQWVEGVSERSVGYTVSTIYDLSGDEATRALERLNAVPPPTNLTADHILVLMARNNATGLIHSEAMVGFFTGGCITARLRYDAASVSSWVNDAGEGV
jgi:hypothetical protein